MLITNETLLWKLEDLRVWLIHRGDHYQPNGTLVETLITRRQ